MDKIYEIGIVRRADGDQVEVEVARASSCGENCASCKMGCQGTGIIVRLDNPVKARVGDRVRIQAASKHIATIALFTYLVPLLMMITGMVYGSKLVQRLHPGADTNLTGLVFGIAALLFFYLLLKAVGGRLAKGKKTKPRIVGIIDK